MPRFPVWKQFCNIQGCRGDIVKKVIERFERGIFVGIHVSKTASKALKVAGAVRPQSKFRKTKGCKK